MKIIISKIHLGPTHGLNQSTLVVKIDNPDILKDYFEILNESKIPTLRKFVQVSDDEYVIPYFNEEASKLVLNFLGDGGDREKLISELGNFSTLGQNSNYFLSDALELSIPFQKFGPNEWIFGTGILSHKISSTSTKFTSVIGVNLSKNKLNTSKLLRDNGLPGSYTIPVFDLESALEIANKIGYPVVIKPIDRDNGDGVFSGIRNDETLRHFYQETLKYSNNILIEKHINGRGHRITIHNGKIISITEKYPWGITGDGVHKISELLESTDYEIISCLEDSGLDLEYILENDRFIPLRRKNNASAGGITKVFPQENVHEDNIELVRNISKIFLLDIVGVDLIIPDISKSWLEQECVIPDVNSIPQIGFDRTKIIFDNLFQSNYTIPIYLLITNNMDSPNINKIVNEHSIQSVSTSIGYYKNGKMVANRFNNGFQSAISMIFNSETTSGLVVMRKEGISTFGLPFFHFKSVYHEEELDKNLNDILIGQKIIRI